MKILLAEYATANDPALAPEGAAMLAVLKKSFERCGYDAESPGNGDFAAEIERIAPSCDMGLVIAPDHLLSRYTQILEQHTHNLGCGFMTVALCANKVQDRKDPARRMAWQFRRSTGRDKSDKTGEGLWSTGREDHHRLTGCRGVRTTVY